MVVEKKKISEAEKIEAGNLMEEASEIFEGCIKCGMCKGLCSVFGVLKEEGVSARGHGILLSDKVMDKIVFECNLCKACEKSCPLNIKVCDAVLKAREAMVLRGKGLNSNEEMIDNVRKSGNPFGEDGVDEKGKLYCC
jgi:glycolate oxidase iron-sulfur subunit